VRPKGLGKLIKIFHLIGSRTRDLPVCNIALFTNRMKHKVHYVEKTDFKFLSRQYPKQTPWPLVREPTIPTERPPRRNLEPTFVDRGVSRGQRGGTPTVVNPRFLDRSRYFSFKKLLIYPHRG
jgi:hypothetical protein